MKSKKKVFVTVLCAVLLVAASVLGTMAYLTSNDEVVNTFTVGKVEMTLDEADVNTDGTYVTDVNNRTDKNTYHLIPGHRYIKDPTIHLDAASEKCYVFVKLENGLKDIIDQTTIETQMTNNGWTLIDATNNIYAKTGIVDPSANPNHVVFSDFKLTGNADVSEYATANITVTGYAVQADGFGTAQDAWNATFGTPANGTGDVTGSDSE